MPLIAQLDAVPVLLGIAALLVFRVLLGNRHFGPGRGAGASEGSVAVQ